MKIVDEPYDKQMRHAKWAFIILASTFAIILVSWLIS